MFGSELCCTNRRASEESISLRTEPKATGQILYWPRHEPQLIAGTTVNPSVQERHVLFAAADVGSTNQRCEKHKDFGKLLRRTRSVGC